jgi:hypothetical protein
MAANIAEIDAHEQPSEELKAQWKAYSRVQDSDIGNIDIDDIQDPNFRTQGVIPASKINEAIGHLIDDDGFRNLVEADASVFEHPLVPGRHPIPSVSLRRGS